MDNINRNNLPELPAQPDTLEHYGVKGMKWGVIRANKKIKKNKALLKKADRNDSLASYYGAKGDKTHALLDTRRGYRYARKAGTYAKSALRAEKHARNATDPYKRAKAERYAAKYRYQEKYYRAKTDRLTKTTGYGRRAMKYCIRSERYARKAAYARLLVSSNNYYIERMNRKVSSLSNDDRKKIERYLGELS